MTTMAALLGTLPIAVGIGAGSDLRQPLGIAVVGGLIVSQALTLFTTPVPSLYMDRVNQFFTCTPPEAHKPPEAALEPQLKDNPVRILRT